MDDLRSLIREVLTQELRAIRSAAGGGNITREAIALNSDADLGAFVRRLLDMAQDPAKRADLLAGRHLFTLDRPAPAYTPPPRSYAPPPQAAPSQPTPPAPAARQALAKTLLTERDVDALPQGTAVVTIAKSARLTPLARDELRRRNIKIERAAQ